MNKRILLSVLVALGVFASSLPCFALDIYVRNQPYKGEVNGAGTALEFRLDEMAKALEVEFEQQDGVWKLNGKTVKVKVEGEQAWVTLESLKAAGVKINHSPELGTLDIYKPDVPKVASTGGAKTADPSKARWAGGYTLVYFGSDG